MKSEDITAVLKRNDETARKLGIQGTPAFLIDTKLIPGAVGYASLLADIAEVRKKGGCTIC